MLATVAARRKSVSSVGLSSKIGWQRVTKPVASVQIRLLTDKNAKIVNTSKNS